MGRVQPDRPAQEVSMSVSVDPCASPPSGTLSCYVTTATAVAAAITFSASGAAPTPLYQEYQKHFGLSPFMITIIFKWAGSTLKKESQTLTDGPSSPFAR
jgi:hypothetical protein